MKTTRPDAHPARDRLVPVGIGVAFSAFLVPGWIAALTGLPPGWRVVLAGAAAVAYTAGTVAAVPLADRVGPGAQRAGVLGLLALGVGTVALLGLDSSWLLVSAVAVAAVLLPARPVAVLTGVLAGGLLAAASLTGSPGSQRENVLILLAVAIGVALTAALAHANAELQRARDEIAELAVTRERMRIARDLHDILGHSLTTIVVKAGLARRLIAAGAVDRGAAEAGDVERLARHALSDVRQTVADARTSTSPGSSPSRRRPAGGRPGGRSAARRRRGRAGATAGLRRRAAGGRHERRAALRCAPGERAHRPRLDHRHRRRPRTGARRRAGDRGGLPAVVAGRVRSGGGPGRGAVPGAELPVPEPGLVGGGHRPAVGVGDVRAARAARRARPDLSGGAIAPPDSPRAAARTARGSGWRAGRRRRAAPPRPPIRAR